METLTLNAKQQRRADILHRLLANRLTIEQAAQLLDLSSRQIRRLRTRFQEQGLKSVIHANTGRAPKHKTAPKVLESLARLAGPGGKYADFNVCHLHEKLVEQEGLALGRSTLDRLLKKEHLRKSKRQKPTPLRRYRDRYRREGQLLQIDGSLHAWLEERGPKMCLLAAIDDATSKIVYAHFHPTECQEGYLRLLVTIASQYGLPEALYHDKHTLLRSPKKASLEEELAGKEPMSQIQRILEELGIASIAAHSPQAKGRIERLFESLQDRLIKEMRLAGILTREAANTFLPSFLERFNCRFATKPAEKEDAWVALPEDLDRDYYFAIRETRKVRADHTLAFRGQRLSIARSDKQASLAGKRVFVHVTYEGKLCLYDGKKSLSYHKLVVPVMANPADKPLQKSKPADPKAQARRRGWLFTEVA